MIPLQYSNRVFPIADTGMPLPTDATLDDQARYVIGDLRRATPAYKIAVLRHLIDPEAAGRHYQARQYDSVWTGLEAGHRLLQAAKRTGAEPDLIRRASLDMVRASLPVYLSQQFEALKDAAGYPLEAFGNAGAQARAGLQVKLHSLEVLAQQGAFPSELPTGLEAPQWETLVRQDLREFKAGNASGSTVPANANSPIDRVLNMSVRERPAAPGPAAGAHFSAAARQNHYVLTVRQENALPYAVNEGMHRYRQRFLDRSEAQSRLYALFGNEEAHFASDIQAFCAMPAACTQTVVFERELETRDGRAHFSSGVNEAVLGNARAAMRDLPQARMAGNQLALLMRVPMWTGQGQPRDIHRAVTASPLILSVCAPALDESDEPEWNEYVDSNGALRTKAYVLAMATIAEQIVDAASCYPDHKVVLCAFGMNNYLSGLTDDARAEAFATGVANMRALIEKLQELDKPLGYTDGAQDSPFWNEVNRGLMTKIGYEGRVPGVWVTGKTMIVNAWDPCSLVGNGCKADDSMDGYVGRSSLVHEAHAHAILSWRNKLLNWQ